MIGGPLIAFLPSKVSPKVFDAVHSRFPEVEKLSGLEAAVHHMTGSAVVEEVFGVSAGIFSVIYHYTDKDMLPLYGAAAMVVLIMDSAGRIANSRRNGQPAGIGEGIIYWAQSAGRLGSNVVSRLRHTHYTP